MWYGNERGNRTGGVVIVTEQVQATATEESANSDIEGYRTTHLSDDLADDIRERGDVQIAAPFRMGGIKPRVHNRVTFTLDEDAGEGQRQLIESVLETERYEWTHGEPGQYVVLGRKIEDLRELRRGDRIHLNKRRGPFKVYRVMERSPEVLQRSGPAITVELSNEDTDTDWLLVEWEATSDPLPWSYCRTKDKHAKGGFRYRKVEQAERLGRIGPRRMFAPSHDSEVIDEDYQDELSDLVAEAMDDGDVSISDVHPSDVDRLNNLMESPVADVFTPEDANLIHEVLESMADAFERSADALTIESDEGKEDAAESQAFAQQARAFSGAFNLSRMDAVTSEDVDFYVCEDCGKSYTNRYAYPTHRRECPQDGDDGE